MDKYSNCCIICIKTYTIMGLEIKSYNQYWVFNRCLLVGYVFKNNLHSYLDIIKNINSINHVSSIQNSLLNALATYAALVATYVAFMGYNPLFVRFLVRHCRPSSAPGYQIRNFLTISTHDI